MCTPKLFHALHTKRARSLTIRLKPFTHIYTRAITHTYVTYMRCTHTYALRPLCQLLHPHICIHTCTHPICVISLTLHNGAQALRSTLVTKDAPCCSKSDTTESEPIWTDMSTTRPTKCQGGWLSHHTFLNIWAHMCWCEMSLHEAKKSCAVQGVSQVVLEQF